MSRIRFLFIFFTVSAIVLAGGSHVFAVQVQRTWVSGTGSAYSSCSRSSPCATFATALALTEAGGVISVAGQGDFGPVTITSSVTIDGGGTFAGILVSGTGITVAAGPSDTVILRGLQIDGAGIGHTGVDFQSGGSLYMEKCTISGVTTYGVLFEPLLGGKLIISDTTIENNVNPVASPVPAAISLSPSSSAMSQSTVTIDKTRIRGYAVGLSVGSHVKALVSDCVISGNSKQGISVHGNSLVSTENCVVANNGGAGILVNAASATVLISGDTIVNNGAGLVKGNSGGSIISTSPATNTIAEDSGSTGAPTGTVPLE